MIRAGGAGVVVAILYDVVAAIVVGAVVVVVNVIDDDQFVDLAVVDDDCARSGTGGHRVIDVILPPAVLVIAVNGRHSGGYVRCRLARISKRGKAVKNRDDRVREVWSRYG